MGSVGANEAGGQWVSGAARRDVARKKSKGQSLAQPLLSHTSQSFIGKV